MTKLASTSETAIALCFLVMNLETWLAAIFLRLFFKERGSCLTTKWALFAFPSYYKVAKYGSV